MLDPVAPDQQQAPLAVQRQDLLDRQSSPAAGGVGRLAKSEAAREQRGRADQGQNEQQRERELQVGCQGHSPGPLGMSREPLAAPARRAHSCPSRANSCCSSISRVSHSAASCFGIDLSMSQRSRIAGRIGVRSTSTPSAINARARAIWREAHSS